MEIDDRMEDDFQPLGMDSNLNDNYFDADMDTIKPGVQEMNSDRREIRIDKEVGA